MTDGYHFSDIETENYIMTPAQQAQWNLYACIPRCLIRLTEINGDPISRDDFCVQAEQFFVDAPNKYGLFPIDRVPNVLPLLSLPANTVESGDYAFVMNRLNNGNRLILMYSHIDFNPGSANILHHCSVLTDMNPQAFSIWTPCQNGNDIPLSFNVQDWAAKQCSAVVIS